MNHTQSSSNHHSTQNSVGEVDIPEPHQPGCNPPKIQTPHEPPERKDNDETFFISLYPTGEEIVHIQTNSSRAVKSDLANPDQCGCGCEPEPLE